MLKSVIDSFPIVFVKLYQDEVGAIDLAIRATADPFAVPAILADQNFYAIDPWNNPLEVNRTVEINETIGDEDEG